MWNDSDGQWHMMGLSGAAWGMMLLLLLIVIAGAVALVLVIRETNRTPDRRTAPRQSER
jgi:hypothetical protein